ncbi:MAG: TIGR01459 family HAD-type hydrolase [Hyphomicrobiaceae bacterium]
MSGSVPPVPIVSSIAPLADTTDAWLVDVWGVMHNGVQPFMSSCDTCVAFRQSGGVIVLLTNAPRPAAAVVAQLDAIGVPRKAYDSVVTSGDVTRGQVEAWQDKRIFHLGPERDRGIFAGFEIQFAAAEDAECIVCTGLFDDEAEDPDDYNDLLTGFRLRDLTMLCANPDIQVERGDRIVYCAGALAKKFEDDGGKVLYSGKPHPPIYGVARDCVDKLIGKSVALERILAIGDGVRTDIAGASAVGLRSVFVASGIHIPRGEEFGSGHLEALFGDLASSRPVAAMERLHW